jgi:hypothetical protein
VPRRIGSTEARAEFSSKASLEKEHTFLFEIQKEKENKASV